MNASDVYDLFGLNHPLFHLINDLSSPWLDLAMLLSTVLSDYGRIIIYGPLLLAIAVPVVWRHFARRRLTDVCLWLVSIATLFGAVVLDGAFLAVIKPLLDMPRPVLALGAGAVKVLGAVELHHSFPSGHASFATLLVVSLWLILPGFGRILALLFLAAAAVSRIYVGAHFPVDVLAGVVTSFIIAMAARNVALLTVPGLVRRFAGWRARSARAG